MVSGTGNLYVGHMVQFYGHDEELGDAVAGYLLEALHVGGAVIVVATQAHRRVFEARLGQAGADLAAAGQSGAYLALDASEALDALMPGGRLDGDAFERVIGGAVSQAARGGRPVRAYGEMVALLWDAGLVDAVVQLEEMWNSLGRRHRFSLLCGYPAGTVTRDGEVDAFAEVCRLHSEVLGPAPDAITGPGPAGAARAFALSRDAPAAARHFAVGALRSLGAADLAEDVALVVTELAANAVVHARSGFTVDLLPRADVLRVSVRDAGPLPSGGAAALPAVPLHGLGAVDMLASRWGVEPLGQVGKAVWVDLPR